MHLCDIDNTLFVPRRRQQQPRDRPLHPATPSSDLYYKEGHSTMRSTGYSTMEQKKYAQYKDKHPKPPPGSLQRQQENEYAYNLNMELRPLPSIPNVNELDEAASLQGGDGGPGTGNCSSTSASPPPTGGVPMFGPHGEGAYQRSPVALHHHPYPPHHHHLHHHQIPSYDHTYFTAPSENGGVGPHYFELDPDGIPLPPPPPEDLGPLQSPLLAAPGGSGSGGSRYRPPVPALRPLLAGSTGPGHKSPEQENMENVGKETGNTSCQDISSSPIPSNGQLTFQETGNCSWP